MSQWTKVVTEPLGLVGFALFLVFGLLAKVKQSKERRWLSPLAAFMAVTALIAGLGLGYLRVEKQGSAAVASQQGRQTAAQPQLTNVDQHTEGAGSPAVQDVVGNVDIKVDQSGGTAQTAKVPRSKPTKKSAEQKSTQ